MAKPRALSGIKPSGAPHLGNYLGFIKPALRLRETHETFYFVADYHAMTTVHNAQDLRSFSYEIAAVFAALGMDHQNHAFFRQSDVPEVCELAWILSCSTGHGLLERAHAFKDAQANGREVNAGLFLYPVLMAADILIYASNYVPVGRDQKQHLEIARDIAQSFNYTYGNTLTLPEALIEDEVATIPGLDGRKMSKSYNNTIPLFSTEKQLRKAVMRIVTDSKGVAEAKDPDTCNVFQLFRLFATKAQAEALAERYRAGGMGYGEAKEACHEAINAEIGPHRERYFELRGDYKALDGILEAGRDKARGVARGVMAKVRERVGL